MKNYVFLAGLLSLVACDAEEKEVADGQVELEDSVVDLESTVDELSTDCATKDEMEQLTQMITDQNETIATLTDSLDALLLIIEQNGNDISENSDAITENSSNIDENLAKIESNSLDISFHAIDIAANTAQIETNTAAIASNDADILTNADSIANNTAQTSTNTTAIASNDVDILTNADAIAALSSEALTNTANITQNSTDIATAVSNIENIQAEYISSDELEARTIKSSTIWTVGPSASADYPDLPTALDAANDLRIHSDGYLTLQLEDGDHNLTETINITHPDGRRLLIVGNSADPAAVRLLFSSVDASIGVRVDHGYVLGQLSGMTIQGDGVDSIHGIYTLNSSYIYIDNLIVDGWQIGIRADNNAVLYGLDDSIETRNNTDAGAFTQFGGLMVVNGLDSHDNGSGASVNWGAMGIFNDASFENNNTFGLGTAWNATVHAKGASATGNGTTGFQTGYGSSSYHAEGSSANNGTHYGFHAYSGGISYAQYTSSTGNNTGYAVGYQSLMFANFSTTSGNTVEDFNVGPSDDGYNRMIIR